jgi:hypothetical protein
MLQDNAVEETPWYKYAKNELQGTNMFTPFVSMLLQEISTVLGDLQKTSHPN